MLIVTHYYPEHGGGVEIVAGQLAKRMSDATRLSWYAAAPAGGLALPGVAVRPMRCWNGLERRFGLPIPIPSPRAAVAVARAARSADLVWVHDLIYPANLVAALTAVAAGRPLVVTVHVGAIPYPNAFVRRSMAIAVALAGRLLLTRAAAVAFVSERVRDEFVARWRLRYPRLIPNGVDLQTFKPISPADRSRVRAELRLRDGPVVLFVGRFVQRKGLGLLRDLATRMPSIDWVFAGRGPIDPGAWALPNVRVERERSGESLAELYGAADLLALPSVGEGFPLVVGEALATGLPVLVDPSTVAGYRAVAAVANSEPVQGADVVDRWAARIGDLLDNATGLAAMASRRVEFAGNHWDWDRAGAAYAELFADVFGDGAREPVRPAR